MSDKLPNVEEIFTGKDMVLVPVNVTVATNFEAPYVTRNHLHHLMVQERLDEANGYCDDGHYHDKRRDVVILPSERISELEAQLNTSRSESGGVQG